MNSRSMSYVIAALLAAAGVSHAGPVGPLTTFTAGFAAKASEVNGNFSAVSTAVNDNNSRVTALEGVNTAGRLTTLEGANAAGRITALESVNTAGRLTLLETTVTPAGNIVLVPSTAGAGNILKGTAPFIHNFGPDNIFAGVNAGNFTMSGPRNAAVGVGVLQNNTFGGNNAAIGWNALNSNTSGGGNAVVGQHALFSNTTGNQNVAIGLSALASNTIASNNTANGTAALLNNTTAENNTAIGAFTLQASSGANNTAVGMKALFNNTGGSSNTAIGYNAGFNLTTGSSNIVIDNQGVAGESETIRIGTFQLRTFIAGIRGVTTFNNDAISVMIDSNGQLGTVSSSRRVKDDIIDMDKASERLMQLRPVTFHYKSDQNPAGRTLQYGLVAEEVAKVAPGLVAHSADGRIETVYYQFLAPMLLNEYQKQQRTIEAQAADLNEQKLEIAELRQQAARMAVLVGKLEQAQRVTTAAR